MEKSVKEILAENGFSFKKKFGQNFITDKNLLDSIVAVCGVGEEDTVLEIGCGAGTLTRALAARAKKVVAYEVDRQLLPVLAQTLAGVENAEVIFGDFMKADLGKIEREIGEYKVVANLPYYITTPLILKICENSKKCAQISVMVQREVADRLCARENTPEYGALTAAVALRCSAKIVKEVSRNMFMPRPQVDSAVVTLTVEDGRLGEVDEAVYKRFVRAAFLNRRKTYVNNLMAEFNLTREGAEELLKGCGIDVGCRGETLSPETFARLANIYNK